MPLSEAQAAAIVSVVANDPQCKKYIPTSEAVAPSKLNGTGRNLWLFITDNGKKKESTNHAVCTGIARMTKDALNAVVEADARAKVSLLKRRLPGVSGAAESAERTGKLGFKHTATKVTIKSGAGFAEYVFDWHATLSIWNPLIYPSEQAFLDSTGEVYYSDFTGFK